MTTAQLEGWKAAKDQYMTSKGGIVSVLALDDYGHNGLHVHDRWLDSTKQIALGLHTQGSAFKAIPYRLTNITGQTPGGNSIRDWVRYFQQRYSTPKAPL